MTSLWLLMVITVAPILFVVAFELDDRQNNERRMLMIGLSFLGFIALIAFSCMASTTMPVIFHSLNISVKEGVTQTFEWFGLILGFLFIPIFVSTPPIEQNDTTKFVAMAILLGVAVIGSTIVALL